MLLLQPAGNMLSVQLFIIIGANAVAVGKNMPFSPATILATNDNINNNSSRCNNNINDVAFVKFLKCISQEQSFTTIVILTNWQWAAATTKLKLKSTSIPPPKIGTSNTSTSHQNDYCVNLKYFGEYFQHHSPVLLLQTQQRDYTLHKKFNSAFVTIVCVPPLLLLPQRQVIANVAQNRLLRALSKNLLYLRSNRVILRLDMHSDEGENLRNIESILRYCHQEQIVNVIIVSYQFPHSDTLYYSYEKFPQFEVRKYNYSWPEDAAEAGGVSHKVFPNKLSNLKGYTLYTLPDQIEPRSMIYYDSHDHLQMCGYVAQFVKYFIQGLNGTLAFRFQVKEGSVIFYADMLKYVRNGTVDIAVSLTDHIKNTDWSEYSYPLEIVSWCVMLPMETEISRAEIYSAILNKYFVGNLVILFMCFTFLLLVVFKRTHSFSYRIYLADILINDKALRAILGLGFPFNDKHLDCFAVCIIILKDIAGFTVAALFSIFLGSFMTSPPKYPSIRSFEQLDRSDINILISSEEYESAYPNNYLKYPHLFHIVNLYSEFKVIRNAFNTSHAYPVTTSAWQVYAAQQKYFSRQLFRFSNELCLNRYIHLSFILPMHSVFRDAIHASILRAYSSGLFYHWFKSTFYELVALGRRHFADITEAHQLLPIAVADLTFVFFGYFLLIMLSMGVFVVELIMGYIGQQM